MSEPKNHHYLPKCYSKFFVNSDGYIFIADAWDHSRIFPRRPDDAFTSKYMYSQPVHAENRFDNAIENLFSHQIETKWPPIVAKLEQRTTICETDWWDINQFIASSIIRVPLTFHSIIEILRKSVLQYTPKDIDPIPDVLADLHFNTIGKKSGAPLQFSDLVDSGTVEIGVDPHRCILSMAHLIDSIEIFKPGFPFGRPKILHNKTAINFISSDNPVCYFGGTKFALDRRPYDITGRTFTFIFPISSTMLITNSSFHKSNDTHVDIYDRGIISNINNIISAFSYRYIFSNDDSQLSSWTKNQNICPRPDFRRSIYGNGEVFKIAYKFGHATPFKNKWNYDISR